MFEIRQGEIYRIWFVNDPSGKSYVGQTVNGARNRVREHIADAFDPNKGGCPLLDKATRKFGVENMRYEILANGIRTREELNVAEEFWIKRYNSKAPGGYNIQSGGYHAQGDSYINMPNNIGYTALFENPVASTLAQLALDRTKLGSEAKTLVRKVLGF